MSVGWLKVRRTDYETFEKQIIMSHAFHWDISSADPGRLILSQRSLDYRKTPWSYNLGQNHHIAQILLTPELFRHSAADIPLPLVWSSTLP